MPKTVRYGESIQNIVTSDPLIDDVSYSPLKQMEEIEYHNNTVVTNTYDPNQAYRLTQKETVNMFDDVLQDLTYTYDEVGNITQLEDNSETQLAKIMEYQYDNLYRLTRASSTHAISGPDYLRTYEYDPIGNILNKSELGDYTYNNTNPYQASDISGTGYTYDSNGNLTSDGNQAYTYNYNDRLIQVDIDEEKTLTNKYDQSGLRTYKRLTTDTLDTLFNPITYLDITYYPNKVYEENIWQVEGDPLSQSTKENRHIFLGNQTIANIRKVNDNPEKILIFSDHLGSSSILTDSLSRVKTLYDYYPYGSSRQEIEDGLHISAKRYTGQELDDETNLHYYKARYYEQDIGRFTQSDPLQNYLVMNVKDRTGRELWQILINPIALNAYAYSGNNPINYIDPNGETFWAWATGKQSTEDYVIEIGQAGEYLYNNNALARWMMDHPYATGVIIGVSTAAIVGGVSVIASFSIVATEATVTTIGFNVAQQYDKLNKAAKGAYEIAKNGGDHKGFLGNVRKLNQTVEQTKKGINSLRGVANQHLNWIKDPTTYYKYENFIKQTVEQQKNTLETWYGHAARNIEQMRILEGYLKEITKK